MTVIAVYTLGTSYALLILLLFGELQVPAGKRSTRSVTSLPTKGGKSGTTTSTKTTTITRTVTTSSRSGAVVGIDYKF